MTFEDALDSLDGQLGTSAAHAGGVKVASTVGGWHPSATPEPLLPVPPPGHVPHHVNGSDGDAA